MTRQASAKTVSLMSHYEGLGPNVRDGRAYPYKDCVGVWTVGRGHAIRPNEHFEKGLTVPEEVDALFQKDLSTRFVPYVEHLVKVPLDDNQFGATLSLVYNNGPDPLTHTFGKLLNQKKYHEAWLEMPRWVYGEVHTKSGPKRGPISGLTFRRYTELWFALTGEVVFAQTWDSAHDLIERIRAHYASIGVHFGLPYFSPAQHVA